MSVIKPYRRLNKRQIEEQANHLLRQMQGTVNAPKWPYIADRVTNFLNLSIDWEHIEPDTGGIVAARIYPGLRLIQLNLAFPAIQDNRGLEQSSLAHEVGHWMLHVNQDEADGFVKQLGFAFDQDLTQQPFLCRNVTEQRIYRQQNQTQADWMEWQAQYFASCLLMPRYKLEEVRKGRDLTNPRHLDAMRDELGVTITNLKHRLRDLGWIQIVEGSKQIYAGNMLFEDSNLSQ